jgi:hypothetical protein
MINASNFNINSFSNAAEVLQKGEDTVKMQKKEFVDEHKKLVKVLRSDSHTDDKEEADEQEAELNKIEKDKKGLWDNVNAKRKRGEKPAKPGDEDYPDSEAFKEASKNKLKKSQNMNSVSRFNHFNMASFQENAVDVKSEHNVTDFEEIQKGQISNAFGHSQEIKVDKKGSEIKANLKVARDKEQMECTQFQTQLEAVKANIQTEPTENIDDWATEGLDITIMPKKFNWSECYCNEDNEYSDQSMKSEKQLLCDAKREYNNTAEKFVKCQVELHILDTMMNNIADNKVYSLSVKQAAILGF